MTAPLLRGHEQQRRPWPPKRKSDHGRGGEKQKPATLQPGERCGYASESAGAPMSSGSSPTSLM